MNLPHLPALRRGRPYESIEKLHLTDHASGETKAVLSSVNAGVIRKDLQRLGQARAALRELSCAHLLELCARAGDHFLQGTLPLGDRGHQQSAQQYVETLSATSGLPHVLVRRNMAKIHYALTHMPAILNGLTRGLDLSILDTGRGEQLGTRLSFFPATEALGLVMPSNSPGVNSLWLPAIPLKIPVILKPGREEPWTPYRLIQAFLAAGCPADAFGFYPTDHEGAAEILRGCGRAQIFGDQSTTQAYANNPAIQVHGPGWSKILIGQDCIEQWPDYLDVLMASISDNGGRSCVNASALVVARYGAEIAEALAQRLARLEPARADNPDARLAGFANPRVAESIQAQIEEGLQTPGALDVTARHRDGPRQVAFEGGTYLRPTLIRCDSFDHPLANREFLFPYASVTEIPQPEMLGRIGYSLVITAITRDPVFARQLTEFRFCERLNLGPIPTTSISWDQPHEGNMFEFLWKRRSIDWS